MSDKMREAFCGMIEQAHREGQKSATGREGADHRWETSESCRNIGEMFAALTQQPESDPVYYCRQDAIDNIGGAHVMHHKPVSEFNVPLYTGPKPTPQVPEGFKVVPCSDGEFQGFIIRGPSVDGVRANTSVWADEADPAHALLHALLSAAPSIVDILPAKLALNAVRYAEGQSAQEPDRDYLDIVQAYLNEHWHRAAPYITEKDHD